MTGTEFNLKNKANSYAIGGNGALSQKIFSRPGEGISNDSIDLGFKFNLGFEKISGKWRYGLNYGEESKTYDPNDLGFLFSSNSKDAHVYLDYKVFKPFWRLNRYQASFSINYNRVHDPDVFSDFGLYFETWAMSKKFFAGGLWAKFEPVETYDYWEPRTRDFSRYYTWPTSYNIGGWVSSDYRKTFALDLRANVRDFDQKGRAFLRLFVSPRVRVNDKLSFILGVESLFMNNDVGFVHKNETSIGYDLLSDHDIIFGIRDRIVFDNELKANYIFNEKIGMTLRARHYWTRLEYGEFTRLDEEGYLGPTPYEGIDIGGCTSSQQKF